MEVLEQIRLILGLKTLETGRYPIEVPNFGREQLAQLFCALGYSRGAEIGVKEGDYSETMLKLNPGLLLASIDPWEVSAYYEHGEPHIRGDGIPDEQSVYWGYYQNALKKLSQYPGSNIYRLKSMEAAKHFPDNSLDFVYIDGNHDFEHCTQDICEWSRKVRPGGIVAGHDYTRYPARANIHTKYVVDAYTRALGIKPWFVLGAQEAHVPGVVRDPSRSWFWVRQ